eukprot:14813773-Alexandrium_andersonii.AAC.1
MQRECSGDKGGRGCGELAQFRHAWVVGRAGRVSGGQELGLRRERSRARVGKRFASSTPLAWKPSCAQEKL